jgi:hypothetical protein
MYQSIYCIQVFVSDKIEDKIYKVNKKKIKYFFVHAHTIIKNSYIFAHRLLFCIFFILNNLLL